ncbi:VirB4 family type IV secretion/conjugal transfer ATPase [Azohydromonas lata]|uniref:VirB4 family type IV secretion/conjugal transfer ATPase n=1 Tax=Azohydromonas lata TaxID=45677 RepID=UPI000834B5BC|nr:conjugal transfer protein TrbE [Azohydromonas lata]
MIAVETTAIATACAGAVMVAALVGRMRAADAEMRLKRHRSKDAGLPELLNYAAEIEDGIIVNKDGSFMASWLYRCADQDSATEAEREAMSFRINQALAPLTSGWAMSVDAVRREATDYPPRDASHFPDPVSGAIDEERRRDFTKPGSTYEGYFVVTFTWLAPLLAQRKFTELMFDDESVKPDRTTQTYLLIEQFKSRIAAIENRLSSAFKLTRLRGQPMQDEFGVNYTQDDLLSWLQYCITGIHQPIRLPNNPAYLDSVIGGQDFVPGSIPKIGRKFIQCVSIDGFPLDSYPGMLQALSTLPVEYRWNSRFIFLDQHQARNYMDAFRKRWKQKIRGIFDQMFNTNFGGVNQDAVTMTADAEAAIAEIDSGLVAEGFYTSVVVLMDESREKLKVAAELVEKRIQGLGFTARIEEINNMEAFFGSLPAHCVQNVRRPMVNTMNLADMLPTSSIWTGSAHAPCPLYPKKSPALMQCITKGRTPFRFNVHVRQLGHTLVFGPTRVGKSTLLGLLIAQFLRYHGMRIFVFEAGMSAYALTKAVGGMHYIVGGETDKLQFAPLQYLETRGDLAWAMRWIDHILALNGVNTTPDQRNKIGTALVSMRNSGSKNVSEFVSLIQDEKIREAMEQYTVDGSMGYLVDAPSDNLQFSRVNTFELGEIMEMGEKYALPPMLYLFRRLERSLDGKPTVVFIDEAWLMLTHPVFKEWIRKWLKTLAKLNCTVILSTQNLSDASTSGIFDVLVESTATKILLPNPNAHQPEAKDLYQRVGLNSRQIAILAEAAANQDYYAISEQGNRLFQLDLGPLTLAFVGATDRDSIATIQQLEARLGGAWVHEWLARRGLKLDDYLEAA